MMNFGKELRLELKRQGLTQKEVSRLIGISRNAMSQIILGEALPHKTTLDKLCTVLNIEISFTIKPKGYK